MRRSMVCLVAFAVFAAGALGMARGPCLAQGLLAPADNVSDFRWPRPIPPRRPMPPDRVQPYRIKDISIRGQIDDRVFQAQISQTFTNPNRVPIEARFIFPLPYDGAIDQLTFLVDGKEWEGKLMPADEARRIYEGYVRRYRDPALLEWVGTGMFQTSVFPIPAGGSRTVTIRFTQLLPRDGRITDLLLPLATAKYTSSPVEEVSIEVSIRAPGDLGSIFSPTHDVQIDRPDPRRARVRFDAKGYLPSTDFRLMYDLATNEVGASVLSYWPDEDDHGYFVLLATPVVQSKPDRQTGRKTLILIIDRSGSMSGKKMDQAKESLRFVVNNLNEGDLFNIVAYDSEVEAFRPELQRLTDQTRREALGFVDGLFAGGMTNIDEALKVGLGMIQDASLPNYVLFMTDGLPTVGERNEMRIVENSRQYNTHDARVINLGVGYDVNSRLLDRLSRTHGGQSTYVRPDEDLEAHLGRMYAHLAEPVVVGTELIVQFEAAGEQPGQPVNRLFPSGKFDLFANQQLVIVGRYREGGSAVLTLRGKRDGEAFELSFPVEFAKKGAGQQHGFAARVWAMRRIGDIIDQIDLHGRNEELVKELVELSTRHGIVTPYTSFLADDTVTGRITRGGFPEANRAAGESLRDLDRADGQFGFEQRQIKGDLQVAGGGGFGGARGGGREAAMEAPGRAVYRDPVSGEATILESVLNLSNHTLYRRGQVVIASNAGDVDVERDRGQMVEVERFSEAYFRLVAENNKWENELLAQQAEDQHLVVRLRGQLYYVR